jgi:hypothetical protein
MKKILLKILIIIILLISVLVLPTFYPIGIAIYFRLFLIFLLLIKSLKLFKIIFINKKISKIIANSATVLFSIFVIFILLEAVFMFIPRSSHVGCTLASDLRYAKYWKPINSLGFRDNEPNNSNPAILFIGDSFTAGSGLKFVDDRFSNIVGKELNKKSIEYDAINMGRPGADSLDEYNLMREMLNITGIKPKIIVLQYFGNDIENVAFKNGINYIGYNNPVGSINFLIISNSYLFNYLYWSFPRQNFNLPLGLPYITFLHQVYKNDNILLKYKMISCYLWIMLGKTLYNLSYWYSLF